ncbi:MAG: hypothetical protein K0R54_3447 [Clostridiaceae bacterium]|jgi:hypothetical protein|nr:hypothetical protein [Clostridiaceae bacterium]
MLMQETLTNFCDYDYSNMFAITLYPGSDFNNPEEILFELTQIVSTSKPGDTILFYFAGHGKIYNDEAYLLLPDTKDSDLENTALSLKKLNHCLSENGKSNFIILDACHSGFDCRGVTENLFNDIALKYGSITLASCSKNQKSYPDSELEQGIFTYCLCESIKEFDKNDFIYAEELKIKICNKMLDWCKKKNKQQTPTMNASVTGNISFAQRVDYLPNVIPACKEIDTVSSIHKESTSNIGEEIMEKSIETNELTNNVSLINTTQDLLWESPSGITLPKKADVTTILSYNTQLKSREVTQILFSYNNEFYEMLAEFIWTRAINLLRKKVLSLGIEFVSDMIEIDNTEYITNLPPFETINLAFELGFIDKLGRTRFKNNSELIQQYSLRETEEEMTEDQVKEIIRACIQYVLGQDDSNLHLEYNNFRDKLKIESIDEKQLDIILNSPYFYKKTTTRTLMNLLKETEGSEFSIVSSNMITIIPYIWDTLLSEEKYFIGTNYARYSNDGNTKCIHVLKSVLIKVHGFDYVPENLKSLTFIETAKKLISTHYGTNNFYNEPKVVKDLSSLGTIIPKPALEVVINSTLLIKLGNSYGVSWSAQDDADKILDSIHIEQWRYYLDSLLKSSEYVLAKISYRDERIDRWFKIVEKYHLNELDITNPLIKSLLDKSIDKNKSTVSSIASKLYYKITEN